MSATKTASSGSQRVRERVRWKQAVNRLRRRKPPRIRVYVRRGVGGRYLKNTRRWVVRRQEARVFAGLIEAVRYCVLAGLQDVVLTVISEGRNFGPGITLVQRKPALDEPRELNLYSVVERLQRAAPAVETRQASSNRSP